jgi:hypothetical protein
MAYLTRQEIFNVVWTGLKAQGFQQSLNDGGSECAYRAPDGCKCAFGHLIPDELYDNKIEGSAVGIFVQRYYKNIIPKLCDWFMETFDPEDLDFIRELQKIHDYVASPEQMEKELRRYARENRLDIPND